MEIYLTTLSGELQRSFWVARRLVAYLPRLSFFDSFDRSLDGSAADKHGAKTPTLSNGGREHPRDVDLDNEIGVAFRRDK
jgi:hypothetical protein